MGIHVDTRLPLSAPERGLGGEVSPVIWSVRAPSLGRSMGSPRHGVRYFRLPFTQHRRLTLWQQHERRSGRATR